MQQYLNEQQAIQEVAATKRRSFRTGKRMTFKSFLNGQQSILPMHSSELKTGIVEAIKKQLGLK